MISRYKEMAASPKSILIDDTYSNLERFESYGGHTFLWPDQFRMIDGDEPFEDVYSKLEKKILGM